MKRSLRRHSTRMGVSSREEMERRKRDRECLMWSRTSIRDRDRSIRRGSRRGKEVRAKIDQERVQGEGQDIREDELTHCE